MALVFSTTGRIVGAAVEPKAMGVVAGRWWQGAVWRRRRRRRIVAAVGWALCVAGVDPTALGAAVVEPTTLGSQWRWRVPRAEMDHFRWAKRHKLDGYGHVGSGHGGFGWGEKHARATHQKGRSNREELGGKKHGRKNAGKGATGLKLFTEPFGGRLWGGGVRFEVQRRPGVQKGPPGREEGASGVREIRGEKVVNEVVEWPIIGRSSTALVFVPISRRGGGRVDALRGQEEGGQRDSETMLIASQLGNGASRTQNGTRRLGADRRPDLGAIVLLGVYWTGDTFPLKAPVTRAVTRLSW
ncbi:hypothetical protein EDB85DRAFT_1903165 [Lactarius pseudohatsudake]|nr:hypothetical protein EDB85DRAFT_1903165 [Lactarius pseudohatsudake]